MRTEVSGLQSLMDPLIAPMVVPWTVGFHRPRFQALESAIDASQRKSSVIYSGPLALVASKEARAAFTHPQRESLARSEAHGEKWGLVLVHRLCQLPVLKKFVQTL